MIRAIEVENAKVMGNGSPACVTFSPYFNAIVGGRGTGKSTLVHALRLATRREGELALLPKDSEPRARFEAFCQVARGRDDQGALRPNTTIRLEWQHEANHLRLCWENEGKTLNVAEWRDGRWQRSESQSVHAGRFPVRIFSQGQIAAMASGGRRALLAIIDEAAEVEPLKEALEDAQRTFFAQRARLREIDGKLAVLPEVERQLKELKDKLKTLAQTDHATVLQAYTRAQHQSRAVEETLSQLRASAQALRQTAEQLLLDDWLPQHFTADDDVLAWRRDADAALEQIRQRLLDDAAGLDKTIARLEGDERLAAWRARVAAARAAHTELQARLAAQGVADPQAFARLTQQRQQLEAQRKELEKLQADRKSLQQQIDQQMRLIEERRAAISNRRSAFLEKTLASNAFVKIELVPYGSDAEVIEDSLRELIDVPDERFGDDILQRDEKGRPQGGLAFDLAQAKDKPAAIEQTRRRLIDIDNGFHGKFRNYLAKRWEKPELTDRVKVWFPEDDLRIEYQRDGQWYPIIEGSQGQRSAALLAFLLAFGEEPLVLDQPEDDLDNHLIYDLIVRQIRENKLRRQLIVVTHNPNVVVNGDAELVHVMEFGRGQCFVQQSGALQEKEVRDEVCRVMEGGREAFARRWRRLGKEG